MIKRPVLTGHTFSTCRRYVVRLDHVVLGRILTDRTNPTNTISLLWIVMIFFGNAKYVYAQQKYNLPIVRMTNGLVILVTNLFYFSGELELNAF